MENNTMTLTPLYVKKEDFNEKYIKNINEETEIKILGKYKLTKKDYDNFLVYTNIEKIEVYDMEDFDYQNEIEIKLQKKIQFISDKFKKINLTKIEASTKKQLSITLPFNLFFINDTLYNEEDDFNRLLKYIKNIEILNIKLEDTNIDKILELVNTIETKINKKIPFINCIIENKTIKDIEKLKKLEEERILKIWYEDGITDCTLDEFIIMRKNIDKIVNEIKQKELSNFEKVLYVYDKIKKMNYKKSSDNYSMDGRQLHKIFTTDNLVCSGYSKLISQILNELGIQAGIYKLITKNNQLHTRNIVHIVDEKYDINCIYSMDPTWESTIKEDYAYSLFLTPINKLKEYFPRERFRQDIDVLCGNKTLNEIKLIDKISLYQFFNNKDLTQKEIEVKIEKANKKATINNFCEALINVKVEEGLPKNIIELNIPKIINYNNELTSYLNKEIKTNMNFFETK